MKATNLRMIEMLRALKPLLERRDVIGYAAARNTRQMSNELICKHGTPETDDDGNETGEYKLDMGTPGFAAYVEEVRPFAQIEHDPQIFTIPYERAIGELSGEEILATDFMFEDVDDERM